MACLADRALLRSKRIDQMLQLTEWIDTVAASCNLTATRSETE